MKRIKPLIAVLVIGILLAGGYFIKINMDKAAAEGSEDEVSQIVPSPSPTEAALTVADHKKDSGATERINRDVLPYVGERKEQTKTILEHSQKVIDAYLIGTAEAQGMGDFQLSPFETERLLQADYEQFKGLYADELNRGKETEQELKSYIDGPLPWNKHKDQSLLRIILTIDQAYSGAIDNLSWSNTESTTSGIDEEKEYWMIREIDSNTRFMQARDILQRYYTWLFGGPFAIEDVAAIRP
ncbi:hypothetical protein [Paenibacillus sp. S150]|uniref:hypothetical protein n=1 Tax=Paenibacillus sp. S150 TaxID=2749826 RepID=UPI001C5728EB|nr:hypothetical protein [Paenibacillus sp. S150]MBW4080274.1 hypothetical protein [Paenibacillus sp. S150]